MSTIFEGAKFCSPGTLVTDCFQSAYDRGPDVVKSLVIGVVLGTVFSGTLPAGCVAGATASLATLIHAFTQPIFKEFFTGLSTDFKDLGSLLHVGICALAGHGIVSNLNPPFRIDVFNSVAQTALVMLLTKMLDAVHSFSEIRFKF